MNINDTSLKVLHILDHSLPVYDGYAFRSQNILRAQRRMGWQPIVLTSPKHEESWKGNWREEEIEGFHYYRTGAMRCGGYPFEAELRLLTALASRIQEVVTIEKPDLLHAHSPILNAIPALWICHKWKIPLVYEIRASWEDAGVDHGTYRQNSWKYRLVKYLETWVCNKANQVSVLCQGLKDDLIKRGVSQEKLTIVSNGVNVDEFKTCKPDTTYKEAWKLNEKRVIGFIGSFYRYEGIELLIDAIAHLAEIRPDIVLLLVGEGEMEEALRTQITKLHLQDTVIMPGRIPHDRIPGVYALIDILAFPRYSMRLTELVTPLKPLEAMAMGKPLVASDVGGHRELIQHGYNGILFPAGDVLALAEALDRLLTDPVVCKNIGEQGTSWVHQERSWDKTTAAYLGIYTKALARFR